MKNKCYLCSLPINYHQSIFSLVKRTNDYNEGSVFIHKNCFLKNFILRDLDDRKCVCGKEAHWKQKILYIERRYFKRPRNHTIYLGLSGVLHYSCFLKYWLDKKLTFTRRIYRHG